MTLEFDPTPMPRRRLLVIGVLVATLAVVGLVIRASNLRRDAAAAATSAAFAAAAASASAVVASRSAAAQREEEAQTALSPSVPAGPDPRLLPDGTRLVLTCTPLSSQDVTPDPNASYLARDECGTSQFSLATGARLRYLTADFTRQPILGASGDVYWFEPDTCTRAGVVRVLPADRTAATTAAAVLPSRRGGARTVPAAGWLSESGGLLAWAHTTCTVHPSATEIVVHGAASHRISVPPATVIDGLAVSRYRQLAVSFTESGKSGISVVAVSAAALPHRQLRPPRGCAWGRVAWSGTQIAVIETCGAGRLRVVRLDPDTGTRSAVAALPAGRLAVGTRGLDNGDLLVSVMTPTRTDRALLRVSGTRVTSVGGCPANACLYQQRTAVP